MGDYEMVFQVDVEADREGALAALTTEAGINGWWTDRARVSNRAGDTLEFSFPGMPKPFGMELVHTGPDGVAWQSTGFPPPWAGTRVVWRLSDNPDGPGTRIDMRHGGWEPDNPAIGLVTVGWGQILGHLKRYLATGTPDPFFRN